MVGVRVEDLDALVAYLQMLGTLVDFKLYNAGRSKVRGFLKSLTAGTNQPETLSASRWIGARDRWASATM